MLDLLRQPALRRFFIAHGQSQLGTGAGYVALVLIAYQRLHSSWAIALVLLADFLPGIALSAYFGALADRCSRRRQAIAAELVRAGAFIALAFSGSFAATAGLALLAGVGTALFRPAVSAALPTLVAPEERSRATALHGALFSLGFTLGPAICGLLLLFSSASTVLAANGASFVVSALLLSGIPMDAPAPSSEEADPDGPPRRTAREGIRHLASERQVGAVVLIGAMTVLCAAIINVAEPLLATMPSTQAVRASRSWSACTGRVWWPDPRTRLVSERACRRCAHTSWRALRSMGSLCWAAPWRGACSGHCLASRSPALPNALIVTPEVRLLQELVQERFRGRVFGLRDCVQNASFAAAFITAGALLSITGPRPCMRSAAR